MRDIPLAFQTHLDSGATTLARCWLIERRDGDALALTDHDAPLTMDGRVFDPAAAMEQGAVEGGLGLAPGSASALGALSDERISEADILAGRYDDAVVSLWVVNWEAPQEQRLLTFKGTLGEVRRGPDGFEAELRGPAHRLNQPMGRIYGPLCDAEFGDGRCGVNLDGHRRTCALAGHQNGALAVSGLTEAAGWAANGRVSWRGGAARVAAHRLGDGVALLSPDRALSAPPAPGDAITVIAGCDKRFATCRDRYANAVNFRGFPHMPGTDWALSYAGGGEGGHG